MIEKIIGIYRGLDDEHREVIDFTGDQAKINELIDHANKVDQALEYLAHELDQGLPFPHFTADYSLNMIKRILETK